MFGKQLHRYWILALALALLAVALPGARAEEATGEDGQIYVENEWNYVDGSMDTTNGIPEDAEGVLARIRESGVLRVATEPYWVPQEFIDPNLTGQDSYVGADMEMARLIAERMGVELQILPMSFSDVLNAVAEDRADLAISALAFTPGRASMVTMSKGYYFSGDPTGCGLVIREKNLDVIRTVEDLAGRNIVAQSGSLQEMLMAEHVYNYREFKRLANIEAVYQAVILNRADAGAVDIDTAERYIEDNPDYGLALVPDVRFVIDAKFEGDRVAAKKGEYQLMYFVNGIIDELVASGQYQAWFDEYSAYAERLDL